MTNLINLDLDPNFHQQNKDKNIIKGNKKEQDILNNFLKHFDNLYKKLELFEKEKLTNPEIADLILRSIVALAFSSLDHYLREILKTNLFQILHGDKTPTSKFKNLKLSLPLGKILNVFDKNLKDWVELIMEEINSKNNRGLILSPKQSLLSLHVTENVLQIISEDNIFEKVAVDIGLTIDQVKNKMEKMYKRRNSIVHQMDYNEELGKENPIIKSEVEEILNFYKSFIEKVHSKIINS